MLIIHSMPIADLRPFVRGAHRLSAPAWPNPHDTEFVRGFSGVRLRRRGGFGGWVGERHYCDVRTLVMPNRTRFRRFFTDGCATMRVDVGIGSYVGLNDGVVRWVGSLLRQDVRVGTSRSTLGQAERNLASAYLRASTSAQKHATVQSWWVTGGAPVTIIEAPEWALQLPTHARRLHPMEDASIRAAHFRIEVAGRRHGVWVLRYGLDADRDLLRRLRVALLRTHADREVLKVVLRSLANRRLTSARSETSHQSDPSSALQEYLLEASRRLTKKTRDGLPQQELMALACDYEELVNEGERDELLTALQPIRRQVRERIREVTTPQPPGAGVFYINAERVTIEQNGSKTVTNQNITIGDNNHDITLNQIAASTLQDSLNRVTNSAADEDLKAALVRLHDEVVKATASVPPQGQQAAAASVATLTNAALTAPPDRKWYEVTKEGLLDAATALAAIATPVKECVDAVLRILGL